MGLISEEVKDEIVGNNEKEIIHNEVEKNEKERKMFWEILPTGGLNRGNRINWEESIGYTVKFIYEDIEGEVKITDYESKGQQLYIKYLDKEPFKIKTNGFLKCMLGNLVGKKTGDFKMEIGTYFKDGKRDITITDREYRTNQKDKITYKFYKYRCNKCTYESWIVESNLILGQGCSCCCESPQVAILGINTIWDTDRWMVRLGVYEEDAKTHTKCSNKMVAVTCLDCGRVKDKPTRIVDIYKRHSIGCVCGDGKSYPEKLMFSVLEQLKIPFKTEYSPKWITPKRYDFFFELKNKKYIIEMDGELHEKYNAMSRQTAEESKEIDDYKDNIAKEHNIKIIRINSSMSKMEYIKNNALNSKLNNLFDLNIVNWNLAEEFALSNLCKKACEMKRNNPEMTCKDIGSIMKMCDSSIRIYLKKGTKIWKWINYDAKEEKRKAVSKNGKNAKQVEMFKNKVSLGVFESATELERQSEKLFYVKLYSSKISSVCLGKRNHHHGYTFKYVEDDIKQVV